jgi:hypothetical protein
MTTTNEKYKRLVDLLWEKTKRNKLVWVAEDDGDVNVIIAERRIRIATGRNLDGEPVERLIIMSSDWDVIESFTDEALADELPPREFGNYWRVMSEIHQLAHRQGLGADKAIDDIIAELNDDPPF